MKTLVILTALVFSSFFTAMPDSYAAGISKQEAASIAKSQYPGRVIDVKLITRGDAKAFRVKVLDKSGGMHIVIISKASGDVLSSH